MRSEVGEHRIALFGLAANHRSSVEELLSEDALSLQVAVAGFLGHDISAEKHRNRERHVSQALAERRIREY